MGFSGLLLVFFRVVNAYFIGAPFWILFWLVVLLVWLYFILRYIFVKMPKLKEEIEMKRELEKYLPK
jgi:ABC-type bacteriocin/lantibiotic exporter with double-glycine peptidase domain